MHYMKYKYNGLTPNREGDLIGYALFKSGYVNEDLTEVDPENIWCCLVKEPMRDYAKVKGEGEYFISAIHYSKRGNYLGDEQEFFTITEAL